MIETYQMFLQKACLAVLGMFTFGAFAFAVFSATKGLYARVRRTGRLNVLLAFLAIGAMVVYGGKKPTPSPDDPTPTPGPVDPTPGPDDPTPGPDDPTPGPDDPSKDEDYYLYKSVYGAAPALAASEYNGYLYSGNGDAKGTIQVKVGKPNKNTHQASVKATVLLNGKKISLKAAEKGKAPVSESEPTEVTLVGRGAEACIVILGKDGLSGRYGAYAVDGARNFFTSKDKDEQNAANALLEGHVGPVNVVWDGGSVSVAIAKRGKAKAKGSLADGTKVSAGGLFLVGEKFFCVPVVAQKSKVAFNVWIDGDNGEVSAVGLDGDVIAAGVPGTLSEGSVFHVGSGEPLWNAVDGDVLVAYLPEGVSVRQNGARWELPKAGKVAYQRGTKDVDATKLGENPSGLKLVYKAKDGSFKGSFKVYSDNGGRLKATTVNVTGVMVDGTGYGTASARKLGGADITVSR